MKKPIKTAALSLLVMLISTTAFAQITSDYDHSLDFKSFTTYYFGGWQDDSDAKLAPFDKTRIIDALQTQFTERGMTNVADSSKADVAVVLYVVTKQDTSTTAYTNYTGGMGYGYGAGYGAGWGWGMGPGVMGYDGGMGEATTTYDQDDYTEGTFVVSIYDISTKKLAWQGVIKTVVGENPGKSDKIIPKKIEQLMWKYPVKPNKK